MLFFYDVRPKIYLAQPDDLVWLPTGDCANQTKPDLRCKLSATAPNVITCTRARRVPVRVVESVAGVDHVFYFISPPFLPNGFVSVGRTRRLVRCSGFRPRSSCLSWNASVHHSFVRRPLLPVSPGLAPKSFARVARVKRHQ